MMFVRVYTVLAVCVWLYKGGRYSPLTLKTNAWWWLMRNTQFACVLQEKTVFTAHVQENGMVCWLWFLLVVKGQKRIHVLQFQWWKRYSSLNFLILWKYFLRAGRRSCTAKSWTGYYGWPMVVIAWDWLSGHCNYATVAVKTAHVCMIQKHCKCGKTNYTYVAVKTAHISVSKHSHWKKPAVTSENLFSSTFWKSEKTRVLKSYEKLCQKLYL